ncbi:MAG: beta-lactamase family protein [Flavobacteriaceae bacterium]|nr:beta-lactamase family protein [Flavobacteriaceae bacterium]
MSDRINVLPASWWLWCWMLVSLPVKAQDTSTDSTELRQKLDSVFSTIMEAEHIPGAAYIIVKDGAVLLKGGYGFTSLGEAIDRVDPDSTIFRIGSVSKTFTAMAVLQLADAGKIDLHRPVNDYLKSIQVASPFQKAITPAHQIDHSAGFDELGGRRVFDLTQRVPLSEFLQDRLIPIREPGVVSSYSSYGIALAGLLVEEVSGLPLEEYMRQHIWDPLGMQSTGMQLNDSVEERLSWGYEYRNGVNVPMPWEYYHTYPASDINSTVVDMGKYLLLHLNDGQWNGRSILDKSYCDQMKYPELRVHEKIESFAYGFYEEDIQGFRTVAHGGDMLGYASFLAMVPEENLGAYIVHHHEGTRLRYEVMEVIMAHFSKGETERSEPQPIAQPTDLARFTGNYQWSTFCHGCASGHRPPVHELVENEDGTFSIFGRRFFQVAPFLFRSTDGERTMGFVTNAQGQVQYMSTGGVNVFEKIE